MLEHTILYAEGNSLLIIGPRGSGKTWVSVPFKALHLRLHILFQYQVINEVLQSLNADPKCQGNFLLVKLSGYVHTDDRLALLDIVKQLDLEDSFGDKITVSVIIRHQVELIKVLVYFPDDLLYRCLSHLH